MKKILFFLLGIVTSIYGYTQESYSRLRIDLSGSVSMQQLASLGIETDHGIYQKSAYFESDFSESEKQLLSQHGISFTTLIEDVGKYYSGRLNKPVKEKSDAAKTRSTACHPSAPSYVTPSGFSYGSMGSYLTYQEAMQKMDSLAILYPNLVTPKQAIGSYLTQEGRPIHYLKISDNPNVNESEPQILFDAVHHAREVVTVSQLVYFMYYLCENYSTNPEVQALVDNIEFYFVPVVNPDGYVYNETISPNGGGMWRKNRRVNGGGIFGVDLNRNYGLGWGFNNSGSSPNMNSDTYRGPSGFSEPETQAMRDFCNQHNFKFGMNYHSFSNLIVYPWGYLGTNCDDSVAFRSFCADLTKYNFYKSGTDLETVGYSTNGSSDDWMYGETVTKPMIFAMTPEVGNADDGFWPDPTRILPLCEEANYMNLTVSRYLLEFAEITPATSRLTQNNSGFIKYQINRLGLNNAAFTVSLQGLSSQVASVGSSNNYSNLTLGQPITDSISYSLSAGIIDNTPLKFLLTTSSGSFTRTDTITVIYGNLLEDIFANDCSSLSAWTNNGFAVDATKFVSGPSSIAENASGNYSNNDDAEITTPALDLTNCLRAELNYRATWVLENSYDYVQLEVSINNGATFNPICTRYTQPSNILTFTGEIYTGAVSDWKYEVVDLDDYVGNANVKLRWSFHSDGGLVMQGFNMDDVVIRKLVSFPTELSGALNSDWMIYPNPVSDKIFIQADKDLNYVILHMDGRIVKQGNSKETISTQDLNNGIYQIVLSDPQRNLSKTYKFNVIH